MHTEKCPTLPNELLEDIVGKAWGALDSQSISCIALTSHVFHTLVNKYRFRRLVLHRAGASHDVEHAGSRIRRLADVVRGGCAQERLPDLCSFVTSFEVEMIGFRDLVMPAVEDGNFVYILNNLFRPTDPLQDYSRSSTIYSLSLYIYRKQREPMDSDSQDDAYEGLVWGSLNPDLQWALDSLLRFSKLNRLCLNVVRKLPRDFLRRSGIKHLTLRRCSISYSSSHLQNDVNNVKWKNFGDRDSIAQLESLAIDGSVSCVDIKHIATCFVTDPLFESRTTILPFLTRLSMDITYREEFMDLNEVLQMAPALRELSIGLRMAKDIYCLHDWRRMAVINYDHIPYLQSLSFVDGFVGHLRLIIQLLQNTPQSVNHLGILFVSQPTCDFAIVLDLLKLPWETLDELLLHPSFAGIDHVTIGFQTGMEHWRDFSMDYMNTVIRHLSRRLSSLAQRTLGGLDINFYQKSSTV